MMNYLAMSRTDDQIKAAMQQKLTWEQVVASKIQQSVTRPAVQPTDKMVNVNECVNRESVKSNVVCLVKQMGNDDSSELSESDLSSDTSSEKSESRGSDTSNVDVNSENGSENVNNAEDEVNSKSECANCSECVKLKNEVLKLHFSI